MINEIEQVEGNDLSVCDLLGAVAVVTVRACEAVQMIDFPFVDWWG